jgi:mycothiol synthase
LADRLLEVSIRPATLGDTLVVQRVLDDCTSRYLGRPTTVEQAAARLGEGRGVGDAVIAWSGDEPVGFGHTWFVSNEEVRAFIRVRPEWKGLGVSCLMLEALQKRASSIWEQLGANDIGPALTLTSWAADSAAAGVLTTAGFSPVRHFLQMRIDLSEALVAASFWPEDVALREFRTGDDDLGVFDAFRQCFADHWGNADPDPAEWWRENRDDPASGFDPTLWFIAEANHEMCGFAIGREIEEEEHKVGWVSLVGVLPPWRGRGIGEALLRHSLCIFQDRGLSKAALNVDVDNATGALRLYEKVGMTRRPAFTIWSKDLDRTSP